MSSNQTLLLNTPSAKVPTSQGRSSLFYSGAAALLLILMAFGFQQFYLYGKAYPGRELAPPIRTLLILHGIGMSTWVVLFLLQPLLIVTGNRRVHRMLGQFGIGLAGCIVIFGWQLGIKATQIAPPELKIWGLSPKQFLTVPLISILIFAAFVCVGVWQRRRPEVHRTMMLLATMAAMPAAISRISSLSALYHGTVWEMLFGPFFGMLVVALFLLTIKWVLTRSLDRWFALGYVGLVVSSVLILQLATTDVWDRFASLLLQ